MCALGARGASNCAMPFAETIACGANEWDELVCLHINIPGR